MYSAFPCLVKCCSNIPNEDVESKNMIGNPSSGISCKDNSCSVNVFILPPPIQTSYHSSRTQYHVESTPISIHASMESLCWCNTYHTLVQCLASTNQDDCNMYQDHSRKDLSSFHHPRSEA